MAVESLRLLGVLDGYGDGTFRPGTVLTRAQFCKMAVYAMNGSNELGRYRTVTVFSDVKPSYWAAPYINMAAKGKNIISGYADGKFHPDRTVTVGQAVTILLRMLGYKDEDVGGVWPDSYMAEAALIGLTDGVSGTGNEGLTRGQAAKLFLNLLRADQKEGGSYLATLARPGRGRCWSPPRLTDRGAPERRCRWPPAQFTPWRTARSPTACSTAPRGHCCSARTVMKP